MKKVMAEMYQAIDGKLFASPNEARQLQEFVMFNYDRNNYTDAHWTEDELEWRG